MALVDIGLPGMNGYELAQRLRQLHGWEAVRVVAITGYGREADSRAAHEAGFDLHLVKPVDAVRLQRLLATLSRGSPRVLVDQGQHFQAPAVRNCCAGELYRLKSLSIA